MNRLLLTCGHGPSGPRGAAATMTTDEARTAAAMRVNDFMMIGDRCVVVVFGDDIRGLSRLGSSDRRNG